MAFIRKVKTGSGATAVQICRNRYGKIEVIEHFGSAHTPEMEKKLEQKARERMMEGQGRLFDLKKLGK